MPRLGFSSSHKLWSRFPADNPVTLEGAGLVYIELRPDLDYETIRGNAGIPTLVTQGLYRGFSLPVYAGDNEELFGTICVPNRYDEASDIILELDCWLASAEESKNFNMQVAWEHYCPGTDTVPATSNLLSVETATGAGAAQFQSYVLGFTIDYDIDTPAIIRADDILALRMRRIAASIDDCIGEIVINHYGVIFRRNKLGVPAV